MLYYSVLKDIIGQPTTKQGLIDSIIKKASSIITEYGLEYVLENNKDHYFDIDDNEIIKLSLDLIINYAATNVYKPRWCEYILYNMTADKFIVMVEDNDKTVSIDTLTYNRLVALNRSLCSCAEKVRRDKKLLQSIKDIIANNKFIVKKDDYDACFYYIADEPVMETSGHITIPCIPIECNIDKSEIDIHPWHYAHDYTVSNADELKGKVTDLNGFVDGIFDNVAKENIIDLDRKFYDRIIRENNNFIASHKKHNNEITAKLAGKVSQKEKLQYELAIINNNEKIEKCQKEINDANNSLRSLNVRTINFKNRIKKAVINLNLN